MHGLAHRSFRARAAVSVAQTHTWRHHQHVGSPTPEPAQVGRRCGCGRRAAKASGCAALRRDCPSSCAHAGSAQAQFGPRKVHHFARDCAAGRCTDKDNAPLHPPHPTIHHEHATKSSAGGKPIRRPPPSTPVPASGFRRRRGQARDWPATVCAPTRASPQSVPEQQPLQRSNQHATPSTKSNGCRPELVHIQPLNVLVGPVAGKRARAAGQRVCTCAAALTRWQRSKTSGCRCWCSQTAEHQGESARVSQVVRQHLYLR